MRSLGVTSPWPNTSYPSAVASGNPIAYWPLDETSGIIAHDLSGNGHDATWAGTFTPGVRGLVPTSSDKAAFVPDGPAFGKGAKVIITYSGTQISVEAWIAVSLSPATAQIVSIAVGTNANQHLMQFRLAVGVLQLVMFNAAGTTFTCTGGASLADGSPHYVVGTYDGTNMFTYIDGVQAATLAPAFTMRTGAFTTDLGGHGFAVTSETVGGVIDEVALYNYPLTAATIAAKYLKATTV